MMIDWIAAKPKRVLYLALAAIALVAGLFESHLGKGWLAVAGFVVFIGVAGLLSLMAVGFLYDLEDWEEDDD